MDPHLLLDSLRTGLMQPEELTQGEVVSVLTLAEKEPQMAGSDALARLRLSMSVFRVLDIRRGS